MIGTTILEERESKYNGHLRVVNTWGMGNYIQANGLTQSGGIVESIWKSALKKIKDSKNQKIKNILILGLGGGTLAKLLRKKYPTAKITGVEIDPIMVELGTRHLGLDTSDIEVKIQDVNDYCLMPNAYDLVIVDMYNSDSFPKEFESDDFLKKLVKFPTVIINRLYYGDKRPDTVRFGKKLEKIFKKVTWFYPEANLMFLCYNS